jgi:hypothetical protein
MKFSGREEKRREGGELRKWVRDYHGNLGGFWGRSDVGDSRRIQGEGVTRVSHVASSQLSHDSH